MGLQTVHLVTIRITAVDSRHVPIKSDWGILGRTTTPWQQNMISEFFLEESQTEENEE